MKLRKHLRTGFLAATIGFTVIAVVLLLGIESEPKSKVGIATDVAGTLAALVGAVAIWYQLKKSRDLTEAEFIVNLNDSFTSNLEVKAVYSKIEKSRQSRSTLLSDDDIPAIVSYLTFFETMQSLIQRKILTYQMIDDLFAYRFFVVAHNEFVQEVELIRDASYYRNFFALHKGWSAYRGAQGKPPLFPEYDLARAVSAYHELATVN